MRSSRWPPDWSSFASCEHAFYDGRVSLEVAFEIVFAAGVVVAAGALAGAAFEQVGRRALIGAATAIGIGAVAAWIAFAFEPSTGLAIVGTGLVACELAAVGALGLRRGMARSRALDREFERARAKLTAAVETETRDRTSEIERTLARARADSLSAYAEEERRLAETRRTALEESEERLRHGLAQAFTKVQGQVEQRLASWHQDLDRAQRDLGERLEQVAQRERTLIEALEARLVDDADRLQGVDEEQRAIVVRLREDLARAVSEAAATADAELEAHATERRRALHQVSDRMTARERDLVRRIEREETEASRRIQSSFTDVERRQVEQLERVLDRAAGNFVDAATHEFDGTIRAAREEAARRLQRELERAVQRYVREGQSLIAEQMTRLGESGGQRLEKRFGQVSAGLERERDEFVETLSRRLGEVEADFRGRLTALAEEERALAERLAELTRRIDQSVSRAEQRLDELQGLPR
jgi:hypothetical protein